MAANDKKAQSAVHLPHDHNTPTMALVANKPGLKSFEKVADTFQLISDTTRLQIFWLLCHSEDCVINIAAAVEMSSPAVSHHLRLMKQAGLIDSHKVGKEVYYTLAETEEAHLLHLAVDNILQMKCPNEG